MNHISVYQEVNGIWRWDIVINGRAINSAKLYYASEALANQAALRATAVIQAPAFDARGELLRDPLCESRAQPMPLVTALRCMDYDILQVA